MHLKLQIRGKEGNLRSLKLHEGLIDFASNDYLGLARSSEYASRFIKELAEIPLMGSTGSRLLTGNSSYAVCLENKIASFHGYEAGLLFGSGFMANVGLFSAIATEKDTILFESNSHAST